MPSDKFFEVIDQFPSESVIAEPKRNSLESNSIVVPSFAWPVIVGVEMFTSFSPEYVIVGSSKDELLKVDVSIEMVNCSDEEILPALSVEVTCMT